MIATDPDDNDDSTCGRDGQTCNGICLERRLTESLDGERTINDCLTRELRILYSLY